MLVDKTCISNTKHAPLLRQLERFVYIGGSAFVIDTAILVFLTEVVGFNYLLSAIISFCVSSVYVYILSVTWIFNTKKSSKKETYAKAIIFLALTALGLPLNNLVLYIGVELFAIHYMACKVVATAVVMVFNFITRKLLLEKLEFKISKKNY